jgi:transposase
MSAVTLAHSQTALGPYYRRLAYRLGKPKAVTATVRKLAILVYRVLRGDISYQGPGTEAYEAKHRTRAVHNLRQRADHLDFTLLNTETGEILQPVVS